MINEHSKDTRKVIGGFVAGVSEGVYTLLDFPHYLVDAIGAKRTPRSLGNYAGIAVGILADCSLLNTIVVDGIQNKNVWAIGLAIIVGASNLYSGAKEISNYIERKSLESKVKSEGDKK